MTATTEIRKCYICRKQIRNVSVTIGDKAKYAHRHCYDASEKLTGAVEDLLLRFTEKTGVVVHGLPMKSMMIQASNGEIVSRSYSVDIAISKALDSEQD